MCLAFVLAKVAHEEKRTQLRSVSYVKISGLVAGSDALWINTKHENAYFIARSLLGGSFRTCKTTGNPQDSVP